MQKSVLEREREREKGEGGAVTLCILLTRQGAGEPGRNMTREEPILPEVQGGDDIAISY